jgi:hypothetical protein
MGQLGRALCLYVFLTNPAYKFLPVIKTCGEGLLVLQMALSFATTIAEWPDGFDRVNRPLKIQVNACQGCEWRLARSLEALSVCSPLSRMADGSARCRRG